MNSGGFYQMRLKQASCLFLWATVCPNPGTIQSTFQNELQIFLHFVVYCKVNLCNPILSFTVESVARKDPQSQFYARRHFTSWVPSNGFEVT